MSRESCTDFVIVAQPKRFLPPPLPRCPALPTLCTPSTSGLAVNYSKKWKEKKIIHRFNNIFFRRVKNLYFYSVVFLWLTQNLNVYQALCLCSLTFAVIIIFFFLNHSKMMDQVVNKARYFVRKKNLTRGINFLVCDASAELGVF